MKPTGLDSHEVALVTGGADGIGWAISRRLANGGARVVIADVDAKRATSRARELGDEALAVACDVSDERQVLNMMKAVMRRYGRLDIVVNNAGIGEQPLPTLQQDVNSFDRVIAVHLRGTYLVSREAGRVLVARGAGSIVNISSIAGLQGHPSRNAYGAAKAGISMLTESMACEWARSGVRVNAVAPGYVLTELVMSLAQSGSLDLAELDNRTPMNRTARPEEIAEAVAFLASPLASYITGVTLPVDGGWMALGAHPSRLGSAPAHPIVH